MTPGRPTQTRRSRWIPWCFVGLFAAFLVANATMIFFALDSFPGLTTQDPYRKGLAYNRSLAAAERQAALGWRVAIEAVPAGSGKARVEVALADRTGHAVKARLVRVQLWRPSDDGYDSEAVLSDLGGGRYSGEVMAALPGQWDLRVLIEHADGTYRTRRRVVLAGNGVP